ncbi:mitochondrial ornithine transporter 1-like [Haematobia irritans]|uniref:mitochondrial ornithine transporter 1-like n=1 Tax=Haematobia irritans TaxID=7368 RepID=UPI003F507676
MGACSAKYVGNIVDTMVEDFVWIESDFTITKIEHDSIKHRLIAGFAQVYATQPFDTVKVKLQTFPNTYRCMWECMTITYGNYGLRHGLYAGSLPAVATVILENSILFGTFSHCRSIIVDIKGYTDVRELSVLDNAYAGSMSAVLSSLVLCPTEVLKCKFQAIQDMKRYVEKGSTTSVLTPLQLTTRILKNEGKYGIIEGYAMIIVSLLCSPSKYLLYTFTSLWVPDLLQIVHEEPI